MVDVEHDGHGRISGAAVGQQLDQRKALEGVDSGDDKYAGLFYAPWIHDDVIEDTTEKLESVFYLLAFENKDKYQIFVTYLVYSKENAFSPVMCRITSDAIYYSF